MVVPDRGGEERPPDDARRAIDRIDAGIVDLLARRQAVVRQLAAAKRSRGEPVVDPDRERELMGRLRDLAESRGLYPELAEALFRTVLRASRADQARMLAEGGAPVRSVGIVGLGRFGTFFARQLASRFEVTGTDIEDRSAACAEGGIRWGGLAEAARADLVILCVPIGRLEEAIGDLAPHLEPGDVVIDTASVKIRPVAWMRERLPGGVAAVGTHPLFGPDSAFDGLAGHRAAVCPVRGDGLPTAIAFFESLGVSCEVMDPDDHDRAMAATLCLGQFLLRGMMAAAPDLPAVHTPNAATLHRLGRFTARDTDDLFRDIHRWNPHAAGLRKATLDALAHLDAELSG